MIYLALCALFFINHRKDKNSISFYLFLLLAMSLIFSVLTGRLQEISGDYVLSELYIGIVLYILFYGYHSYSNLKGYSFSDVSVTKFDKIEPYVKWVNIIFFAINLFVFIGVFTLLSSGLITVQEHKNEGGAADIFSTLLPSYYITLSFLLSPVAYFSLVFHFYYMLRCNLGKTVLHLILSLGLVLSGLIALSRSALIIYVMVYAGIYFFLMPIIPSSIGRKIKIALIIALGSLGLVFSSISESRFGERYYIESKPLIDEQEYPQLVSTLDYYSQWVYFGPKLLEKYSPSELSYGMYNCSGLAVLIQQRLYGTEVVNQARERKYDRIMGDLGSAFHGCIVRCVFDFGYIGTFLFILLNVYFMKVFRPMKGLVNLKTLLSLPILLSFCLGFFTGNNYSSLAIDLAIIYLWIFYIIVKKRTVSHGNFNS